MLAIRPDNPSPKHFDSLHYRADVHAPYTVPEYRHSQSRSHSSYASTVESFTCGVTSARPITWQASKSSANRRPTLERLLNFSSDLEFPPVRPQTPLAGFRPFMSAVPSSKSSEIEPDKSVLEQKDRHVNAAAAIDPVPPQETDSSSSLRLPPLQSVINTFDSAPRAPLTTFEPHAGPNLALSLSSARTIPPIQIPRPTVSHEESARPRAIHTDPVFSRPQTAVTSSSSSHTHTPQQHGIVDLMPPALPASGHAYGYTRDRSISNTSTIQSYGGGPLRNALGKRKISEVQEFPAPSGSAVASVSTPRRNASSTSLRIRQQPRACRACGFGERDRRVIDPPPILSFESDDDDSLHYVIIAHASLLDEQGGQDVTHAQPSNRKLGGTLVGNLVASCISGRDEYNRPGKFFVFTDLSCRAYGNYRLRFSLVRLPIGPNQPGTVAPTIDHIVSDVFTVFSAKVSLKSS